MEMLHVNHTLDHTSDIHRTFHPTTAAYTFFTSAHETFAGIDHMMGHRTIFSKFNNFEIIPNIFTFIFQRCYFFLLERECA